MTTTKTPETLVDDIYGLFTSDFEPSEQAVIEFGSRLASHLSTRIGEQRGGGKLRLSNLGTPCERKLWYSINTPEDAEPLPPEARLKFLFGDILEELLLFLAKQAGHTVEGEQDEININGVKGHRDAIIDGRLVDVKSASSRSFEKFASGGLKGDDPFGYTTQLNSYLYGGLDDPLQQEKERASFLVVDKTLGKLCLDTHERDYVNYDALVEEKIRVVNAPEEPERPFSPVDDGKSGNQKLPTICSYCEFKHTCWPGLRTFLYSTGPRYLTTVRREPDVIEVDRNGRVVTAP